jgi:hypothetical protein
MFSSAQWSRSRKLGHKAIAEACHQCKERPTTKSIYQYYDLEVVRIRHQDYPHTVEITLDQPKGTGMDYTEWVRWLEKFRADE